MSEFARPFEYKSALTKCVVRVDNEWYDCTAWRHSHPGGMQLLDQFHEKDCTDAFYAFHSEDALRKLKKMRSQPATEPREEISIAFEKFRKELERDGWFKRNWAIDFIHSIFPTLFLVSVGAYLALATSYHFLATIFLGVGMQQGGWIGHDYAHGRGAVSDFVGSAIGALVNGFSLDWWANKHNTHHTFPNRKEYDSDIHNEPILHLWFPTKDKDVWWRRYQHLYYPVAYSFLFASWRLQSIQYILMSKNWTERFLIAVNYIMLACLPWYVAIGSILLSGLLVAFVVTSNHQTEEILEKDDKYNFVVDQFRTTRGIACPDPITEFLFGGMQYQMEHHLFPIMPRYYYPAVRPLINKFAAENGMQHHISGMVEIFRMNYDVMKKYSQAQ